VQVRKAPSTVNNVVTYDVIIAVDNPEQKTFPRHDGGRLNSRRGTKERPENPQCRAAFHAAGGREG